MRVDLAARGPDRQVAFEPPPIGRHSATRSTHRPPTRFAPRQASSFAGDRERRSLGPRPEGVWQFRRRALGARLVVPHARRSHTVGVFFVEKKSKKLRLIFDTRRCNPLWRDPDKTGLPTANGFGRVEVNAGESLFVAQADVADAFYRVRLPPGAGHFFVLPPASTAHVPGIDPLLAEELCDRASRRAPLRAFSDRSVGAWAEVDEDPGRLADFLIGVGLQNSRGDSAAVPAHLNAPDTGHQATSPLSRARPFHAPGSQLTHALEGGQRGGIKASHVKLRSAPFCSRGDAESTHNRACIGHSSRAS